MLLNVLSVCWTPLYISYYHLTQTEHCNGVLLTNEKLSRDSRIKKGKQLRGIHYLVAKSAEKSFTRGLNLLLA